MTSSRRSCSKSTSMSGGSRRSTDMNRSNRSSRPLRADGRNAEAITNERIGGRAAALTKNAFRLGEADDVVDGQKISGAIQLFDDRQFLGQGFWTCCGTPFGYRRSAPSFVKATSASWPSHSHCGIRWDRCGLSSSSENRQRLRKRVVWPMALDVSPKSRVISSADFRCRSALASRRRPASSSVRCSRMQVTTSCSARRSGA